LLFVIFILAVIESSCAGRPLAIGFVGPLTGPSSAVGLGARNGFQMAFGDGPGAAGGKLGSIKLLIKDDANDQDQCLRAFRELKADGCRLVILATTSQAAQKAIPWAIGEGILVISPTVSDPTFSGTDDLFFRVNESSGSYGEMLARTVLERFGIRTVGLIGDLRNRTYTSAVFDAFSDTYEKLGGNTAFKLEFDSAKSVEPDKMTAEIKRTGTRAIVVVAASSETVIIAKTLEKERLNARLFLPPWPLTVDLLKNGGNAVEGVVAVSVSDMEYRTEAGKAFRDNYLKEYGEGPSYTAMFGWEGAAILRTAISESPRADPLSIKKQILSTGVFQGPQGTIEFNKAGDASRSKFLFEIRGGQFVRIE